MGQSQSLQYTLPLGKRYTISYSPQYNVNEYGFVPETIHINIPILNKNPIDLINSVFYSKLNRMGYSLQQTPIFKNISNVALEDILEQLTIKSKNGIILSDITIKKNCYYPTLANIKALLSQGNVLIAGIILDPLFCNNVLQQVVPTLITDIVLIVGYTPTSVIIKTSWTAETIEVPNEFIANFKEMWDIFMNSPEDKYICQ
jgi:hypothetical protein